MSQGSELLIAYKHTSSSLVLLADKRHQLIDARVDSLSMVSSASSDAFDGMTQPKGSNQTMGVSAHVITSAHCCLPGLTCMLNATNFHSPIFLYLDSSLATILTKIPS